MSVYFIHIILSFLGFTIFTSICAKQRFIYFFVASLIGIIGGILIFKFARYYLLDAQARLIFDLICVVFLFISLSAIFFEFKLKELIFFILGLCYGVEYGAISALFPVFNSELLDTFSILSCFLIAFCILILCGLFFAINKLSKNIKNSHLAMLGLATLLIMLAFKSASLALELMRAGAIQTDPLVLSIVAKSLYISSFSPYIYGSVALIIVLLSLFKIPSLKSRDDIIAYRFSLAAKKGMQAQIKIILALISVVLTLSLYYDLIASKPPKLSDPSYLEPVNDQFVIDTKILSDNKLHRYAYIADDGRVIRFFLLSRFEDRLVPVAVFDACAICGDAGYIKKGSELICIACNVRIFLPSVGKEGGCNPIPMKFELDGDNMIIKLDDVLEGANQFSTIVEKMVKDPVSLEKISNQSNLSYQYKNRSYFFANKENLEKFKADPQSYLGDKK